MSQRMTVDAWIIGFRNAFICGLGLIVVYLAFRVIVVQSTELSGRNATYVTFGIIWLFLFGATFVDYFRAARRAGAVLLDCGSRPMAWLFVLTAVLFLISGVSSFSESFVSGFDSYDFAMGLFYVSGSTFYLFMAFGRLRFVENGIWQYNSLLKWDNIESIGWKGDGTLLIRAKTWMPWQAKGALPIKSKYREKVEILLIEHADITFEA